MNSNGNTARRGMGGVFAGCLLGGVALATLAAPAANAAPCAAGEVAGTVSSVSGATGQFLNAHPGANNVLTNARSQAPADARVSVRSYFTANPGEYYELKNITAPLVDLQNRCGTTGLPPALEQAFNEFQAG